MNYNHRITVEIAKMTIVNGRSETVVAVPYEKKFRYIPDPDKINIIVPEIEKNYKILIKSIKNNTKNKSDYISDFLKNSSNLAIVGLGFIDCLSSDIKVGYNGSFQAVFNCKFVHELINYVRSQHRKSKKEDTIKYIESCQQLIDLFGLNNIIEIFNKNEISIGRSTLQALYNVSVMNPQIKEMIHEKELLLTAAFEIPQIDEEKQIEMALKMKNKNYSEAKKIAKHFSF